jgi:integrase/recombinase XerD
MFDHLVKRSNAVWIYTTGRFAEERHAFLSALNERGHSLHTLKKTNRFLLVIAERVNVRQRMPITDAQILRAAKDWVSKSCAGGSTAKTHEIVTKRFIDVAKKWFRFLGKWREPERNSHFKPELDSFLKELREERGYTDPTISTREQALNLFFDWLGNRSVSLQEVSPEILAAYFVQNKGRDWKKSTVKAYAQSLRAFFRYASRRNWCRPGLAETIQSPRIYSMAALPEGPSWVQIQRLLADLNTERVSHIRDRAIILLLAVYGLRIGEVCALTLDDLDWANEKIRVRRLKNKRIQEFPLTAEVGNVAEVASEKLSSLTDYLRMQIHPITSDWTKDRLSLLREVSDIGLGGLQ